MRFTAGILYPGKSGSRGTPCKSICWQKDDEIIKAPHPETLLRGSLVSPSLEAAIMNAKYVNAVPLYRQEQEFARYGLNISRQNMANWTIQCADRYLAILYDYLHERLYDYHVLQADETPVLVNKDGRDAGSKSYMWVYRTGEMYGIARSSCMNTRRRAMQAIRGNSCGFQRCLCYGRLPGIPHDRR